MKSPLPHPPPSLHDRSCCSLRRLVFTAASLAATAPIAPAREQTPTRPPAYADAAHVEQGCYISTIAYIARLACEFPMERARPLTISLPNFDGPHTVALLTWRGGWWARDEYSGVFALDRLVGADFDEKQLRTRTEQVLRRLASRQLEAGKIDGGTRRTLSPLERHHEVATAAAALPCGSEAFWLRTPDGDLPVLFFQPFPGRIAVYDPAWGTATADCTPTNVPQLVSMVAERLGYRVLSIRAAASAPRFANPTREPGAWGGVDQELGLVSRPPHGSPGSG